jgi:exonuclease SbcD
MRILHTADWHLGRIFQGVSLVEDQAHLLDQLVKAAVDAQPDVVVIAGDLYDRAVPPPEAVSLLDDTLARLVGEVQAPVLIVAGNHDSAERLDFGGRLFPRAGVHVAGRLRAPTPLVFLDEDGPVHFHLVPFAEASKTRAHLAGALDDGARARIANPGDALVALADVSRRFANVSNGRHVLVAHGAVAGASTSESERPLWSGQIVPLDEAEGAAAAADRSAAMTPWMLKAGFVDAARLSAFDYVALGHFHRPQDVGSKRVRYSGSLLAYSFSEADHEKSLTLVDIDGEGALTQELIPLVPKRRMRVVEGELDALLKAARSDPRPDDYLRAVLLDRGPVLDPVGRLRERYPNLLAVEHARLRPPVDDGVDARPVDPLRLDDVTLFDTFFAAMTGEPLDAGDKTELTRLIDEIHAKAREATS